MPGYETCTLMCILLTCLSPTVILFPPRRKRGWGWGPIQVLKQSQAQYGPLKRGGPRFSFFSLPGLANDCLSWKKGPVCSCPRGKSGRFRDGEDLGWGWGWELKEPSPEQSGSPTLFVKAHGLQQLSVTFPQDASNPFPSNQVLGTVLSALGRGKGELHREQR